MSQPPTQMTTDAPEFSPETTARTGTIRRVVLYFAARLLTVAAMVAVGLFGAVLLVNFGGHIDKIFQTNVDEAILGIAMKETELQGEEKEEYLNQIRVEMEKAYGLDKPFLLRSVRWWYQAVTLDWGNATYWLNIRDDFTPKPVGEIILTYLPNTLALAGTTNVLLFFASLGAAMFLSRFRKPWLDKLITALAPISSIPNWILGVILVYFLSIRWNLLPPGGFVTQRTAFADSWAYYADVARHMILPMLAIFFSLFFQGIYTWRAFFLIHSNEDYVELAKAKGLPNRLLERDYVLRPTLPYIITNFTLMLITFWQGVLALEFFFNWPGLGMLFLRSVTMVNRSITLGVLVMFAYLLAITVLLLDFFYVLVDPRIQLTGGGQAQFSHQRKKRRFVVRTSLRLERTATRHTRVQRRLAPGGVWRGWISGWHSLAHSLLAAWRALARYPSALVGLGIILVLVGISIYTITTIPYAEAIRLWRSEKEEKYAIPDLAQPTWTNWFRKDPLPPTFTLDTRNGTAVKESIAQPNGTVIHTLTFAFDYKYKEFPQDVVLRFSGIYQKTQPTVSIRWYTPDGRRIRIKNDAVTSNTLMSLDWLMREKKQSVLGTASGISSLATLFTVPNSNPAQVLPGTYRIEVESYTFEEGSDIEAEMVLRGWVFGLAGTDNQRRDLGIALLWGMPIALAFGLLGAVATSLSTMFLAAVGVWFGGWLDQLIQRVTEINMILPTLPLAITVYYLYGKVIWLILGVVVVLNIFSSSLKSYRAVFLQVKESAYIEAAQSYGAGSWRIIFRYLIPRIMPLLLPQLITLVPGYIFLEATLAFMGVSDIYLPTWGKVIYEAFYNGALQGSAYWALEPTMLLLLTGVAFALVGMALDRILNPSVREV